MDKKDFLKNDIAPFAATNFRTRRVFGIKTDDRRRHMYIIGKTGMGKSTLLENLVYTDILKGHGVAYVDPHGDTAEKMLQWIPEHRLKDVIYFNPADRNFPIAFNVLEKVDPEYRNLVASGLVSVYKKLWADSWGPRLEYILRYAILALLDSPDSTLLGINRMLVDDKYRAIVVARVQDPVVRSFWEDEFTKWNERNLAEVISPIQNKVGQFLSNTMIRNIVGQRDSSFDLRKVMDERKILIMNLSKGRMGEDASALLGAMMITKIQLAAMSRVDIPEEDRKDFYLYVDEFQNFATESFATILSEARKYRLCLIMAHQYIAQLEQGGSTAVRDAVFGNVGTLITFRVGAADAEFLEKEFAPQFTIEDIINLPKFKIYLRLMIDGVATEPFSADALAPLASTDFGLGEKVIEHTRAVYARKKEDIEEYLRIWSRAPGGVIDPAELAKQEVGFHTGTGVLEAFEKIQSAQKSKKDKEAKKFKEREERVSKPIVWRGTCDVDGAPLELTFEPDGTRPILCQDHLKDFRKGALKGPQLDRTMEQVFIRKQQGGGKQKASEKQGGARGNGQRQERQKPTPPIGEGKGTIRIVKSFTDEQAREKEKAQEIVSEKVDAPVREKSEDRPAAPKQQPAAEQKVPHEVQGVQPAREVADSEQQGERKRKKKRKKKKKGNGEAMQPEMQRESVQRTQAQPTPQPPQAPAQQPQPPRPRDVHEQPAPQQPPAPQSAQPKPTDDAASEVVLTSWGNGSFKSLKPGEKVQFDEED